MPIVQTLQGTVLVEARSKQTGENLFRKHETVENRSIGALLDHLVSAAADIAQRVQDSETPDDLRWTVTLSNPSILDIATGSSDPEEVIDIAIVNGPAESIVESAVLIRNRKIMEAFAELKTAKAVRPSSELVEEKPLSELKVTEGSFGEAALYGVTGAQLDALLQQAVLESRVPSTTFNPRTSR